MKVSLELSLGGRGGGIVEALWKMFEIYEENNISGVENPVQVKKVE
jgi:hypothetical protein